MTDPILLTPGPLTTSAATRSAMMHDHGSWDRGFNALTAEVCAALLDIVHGARTHVCVPMQGSGTFAVEAALGTLVPRAGRVLVPDNGAYCRRILRILEVLGRDAVALPFAEHEVVDAARVEAALRADASITHVALVHCETGTGILNPLPEIAAAVARAGRRLIVDAMSSFGVLPIDVRTMPADAIVAASGKCLEGVPGMGFVIAERDALSASEGNVHSLALDLLDQWRYLGATGQWRFTPPTHVVAALHVAIAQYRDEGGLDGRARRYRANLRALVDGMRALGFRTFLPDGVQAPIIVTFHSPTDPAYDFKTFYEAMRERGFILYPGKLTRVDTFRIGCIGAITPRDIDAMLRAVADTLDELGIVLPGAPTEAEAAILAELAHVYEGRARHAYGLSRLNQRAHAVQAGALAREAGMPASLVVAALLHDVGHMVHDLGEHPAARGVDDRHEQLGADWLARRFGPAVVEPVRLHVAAKRYLCAVDPGYAGTLSRDSVESLALQGGPMSLDETATFQASPWWRDAVALRRLDERAKDPDGPMPAFASFEGEIVAALRDAASGARPAQ